MGYRPFPALGLCNMCQHQSPDYNSVFIPANILCFDRMSVSLWSTASADGAVTMGCVLRGGGWMWSLQRGSQKAWEGARRSGMWVGAAARLCTCARVGELVTSEGHRSMALRW